MQQFMGRATLATTMDLYGHLWTDPEGDEAQANTAERLITARSRPLHTVRKFAQGIALLG